MKHIRYTINDNHYNRDSYMLAEIQKWRTLAIVSIVMLVAVTAIRVIPMILGAE